MRNADGHLIKHPVVKVITRLSNGAMRLGICRGEDGDQVCTQPVEKLCNEDSVGVLRGMVVQCTGMLTPLPKLGLLRKLIVLGGSILSDTSWRQRMVCIHRPGERARRAEMCGVIW